MLGAQALRTKQKVEERERQKRQREKQQKLEIQRERIQSAANEDQAMMLELAAQQASAATASQGNHNLHVPHNKLYQRHSLHTTVLNDQLVPLSARDSMQLNGLQKLSLHPTSTDYSKDSENSSGGGNRLFRWLGLSSHNHKKSQKRRMSTY